VKGIRHRLLWIVRNNGCTVHWMCMHDKPHEINNEWPIARTGIDDLAFEWQTDQVMATWLTYNDGILLRTWLLLPKFFVQSYTPVFNQESFAKINNQNCCRSIHMHAKAKTRITSPYGAQPIWWPLDGAGDLHFRILQKHPSTSCYSSWSPGVR
jgi:hypothetical protein